MQVKVIQRAKKEQSALIRILEFLSLAGIFVAALIRPHYSCKIPCWIRGKVLLLKKK